MSRWAKVAQAHAQTLIERMEQDNEWLPYLTPGVGLEAGTPYNPATGRPYRAGNMLMCLIAQHANGYGDNRWMTYKQAQACGAQVKRGAKALQLRYLVVDTYENEQGQEVERKRPIVFNVFNGEQIDGLPQPKNRPAKTEVERHELCEKMLTDSGVPILRDQDVSSGVYNFKADVIRLPRTDRFVSTDAFYATALHELAHATGHPTRLNRDLTGNRLTKEYAKEEIIAETASHILGMELGIGHDPSQHAAYIKYYVEILKEDPSYLFKAASEAEKICDFLGLERYIHQPLEKIHDQEIETNPTLEKVTQQQKEPEMAI